MINLYSRPSIPFPPPHKIIKHAKQHHPTRHQTRVIHRARRRWIRRRPEAEEPDYKQINTSKHIVHNPPYPGDSPWSPDEPEVASPGVDGAGGETSSAGGLDGFSAAGIEEKKRCDEIGCVEAGDR